MAKTHTRRSVAKALALVSLTPFILPATAKDKRTDAEIDEQIKQEFADGKIVEVDGVILSQTEAKLLSTRDIKKRFATKKDDE